jgi:hypothetical protein
MQLRIEKSHYYPTPCTALQPWRFAKWKRELHSHYHQKLIENDIFITESFRKQICLLRYFARHFWYSNNILLKPSRTYFRFWKKDLLVHKQWGLGISFRHYSYSCSDTLTFGKPNSSRQWYNYRMRKIKLYSRFGDRKWIVTNCKNC